MFQAQWATSTATAAHQCIIYAKSVKVTGKLEVNKTRSDNTGRIMTSCVNANN